jgi:hypothetical protein
MKHKTVELRDKHAAPETSNSITSLDNLSVHKSDSSHSSVAHKDSIQREAVEQILDQFKPHETTETRLQGGIVDYEIKLTKDGFNTLADQLLTLLQQSCDEAYLQGRIDEAKTCEKARRHDLKAKGGK